MAPLQVTLEAPQTVDMALKDPTLIQLQAKVNKGNSSVDNATVEFAVDGKPLVRDGKAPYVASWSPNKPGNYQVSVDVVDGSGTRVASNSRRIEVKERPVAPPEVKIEAPQDKSVYDPGQQVQIQVSAQTPIGLRSLTVTANGEQIGEGNTSPLTLFWTPLKSGHYIIQAAGVDERGQRGESAAIGIQISDPQSAAPAPPSENTPPVMQDAEASAIKAAVAGHYTAIGAGNFSAAYSYFSSRYQNKVDRESWIKSETSYQIKSSTINSLQLDSRDGDTATATVDVSFQDKTGNPRFLITWKLIKSGGEWKLDEPLSSKRM